MRIRLFVPIVGLVAGIGVCTVQRPAEAPAAVSYANCDEVRAAGKAPLHSGDPGYSAKLDRDGDGVACS